MYGLTHPIIIEMERKGFVGEENETIAVCTSCDYEIRQDSGDKYYIFGNEIFCESCMEDCCYTA